MSRSRARGATLVEAMIAVALLSLATTLLAGFFSFFTRQSLRYSQREQVVRDGEEAMARIQAVLGESRTAWVVLESSIAGVYFPVADNGERTTFDTSGAMVWQAWEAFGFDSTAGTVWEARRPLGTDTVGKAPAVAPATWTPRQRLASRVKTFAVTGPVDGVFQLRLLLQDATSYQVEFVTSVRPLN